MPFAKRRRRPVPSAAVRRIKSPRHPRAAELYMELALTRIMRGLAITIRKRIPARLVRERAAPEPSTRLDAPGDSDIADLIAALRKETASDLESGVLPKVSDIASQRVIKNSKDEFDRLGIKLTDTEPDLTDMVKEWRRVNVDRVTGMTDDQLDKLEALLENGDGLRAEELQDEIDRQLDDVSESRANLIARDQTLKFNAQVTKERHKAAGIEQYVWTTSNDERVREAHAELEGQTFSWDDPPVINDDGDTGGPGEDYQCRCIPFPILPELDDDEGDDGEEPDDKPVKDDDG